jgi:hypothetical protein
MNRMGLGVLLLAASLVVATPAFGQSRRGTAGVTAGATLGDLQGGSISTSSRWGFTGGVFGNFRTSRNSTIGLQVNYTQKGGKDLARLDYIEIPFLVGAVIPTDNDRINFNLYTGISLAFKVSCSIEETVTLVTCDDAKSTEWAWPIGLGLGVKNANGGIVGLDVRYSIGISDAFEGTVARNRSWQFRAFYGVPMG